MGNIEFEKVRPLRDGIGDDSQLAAIVNKLIRNQGKIIALIDNPFEEEEVVSSEVEIIKAAEEKKALGKPGSCKENSIGMDLQSTVTVEKIEEKEAPQ